ncbi:MAG: hypothetical protein NZ551_09780 [Microscillaceae bacterium]|nr:hypothetical protein [Microscillaceae bacterium]MDW8461488.1 hypothetical protein [Cytophagales bacterium]
MKTKWSLALTILAIFTLLILRAFTANEPQNPNLSVNLEDTLWLTETRKKNIIEQERNKQLHTIHAKYNSQLDSIASDTLFSPYTRKEEPWQTLMSVKYRNWGGTFIPKFEEEQRKLHNQIIELKGFMYALEESETHRVFVLSYYPVSSCFFCGAAGPESVVEVRMKKPIKLYLKRISLKGRLQLNEKDPERLFYILQEAELE